MASKNAQRVKIGPRLFRVGSNFYIRVGIPRDLRDEFRAAGKSPWEIFEPLGSSERREAERLCRSRGAGRQVLGQEADSAGEGG